jgi:Mn2+/Fe2+ NRAMP family transporter
MLDLIRERYGITWALFMVVVVLVANAGVMVAEFVGVGAAAELLGVNRSSSCGCWGSSEAWVAL